MLSTREITYYEFGDFRLDVARQQLLKKGIPQALTNKAFLTLLILVREAGKIVEKDEIIAEIWNDSFVEEANLSQYIYLLRKLLGNDQNGRSYIETITKRGFRFAPCVVKETSQIEAGATVSNTIQSPEKLNQNGLKSAPLSELPANGNKNAAIGQSEKYKVSASPLNVSSKNKPSKLSLAIILIVALSLIFAAVYFYKVYSGSAEKKSIVVLPFQTIGKENDSEKLCLGMADAVIARVNKLKKVQVRSTNPVFNYAAQPPDNAWQMGSELGADAILEGTVQKDKGRVRISVRLTNINDGKSLWAENFDENFTDLSTLQDKISAKVARSLEINLTGEQETEIAQQEIKTQ